MGMNAQFQPKSALRYVLMFCFAHFLHGIGATPLFTIGVSFIDENVGPALSSLFIGQFVIPIVYGSRSTVSGEEDDARGEY